jgi:hypothetical protein
MARARVVRFRCRGGETIPPVRPHRPRLLTALAAVACAVALAAYPLLLSASRTPLLAAVGAAGVIVLVAAVAGRWTAPIPWCVITLGGAYAGALVGRGGGVDPAAPIYAAALFACAELCYWSIDLRPGGMWERPAVLRRLRALATATGTGALGAAAVAVAASLGSAGSGVVTVVLGTVCAVTFVGLLAWLARQPDASADSPAPR